MTRVNPEVGGEQTTGPAPAGNPLLARMNARGFRLLQVADGFALLAVMVLTATVRFGFDWPTYPVRHYLVGFAVATVIHLCVYYFGGLYEREQRLGYRPLLPRVASMTFAAVLLDALAALLTDRYLMPRSHLAVLLVVGSLALTGNRLLARWVRLQRQGPPRVLLVGAPDDVNLARSHLHEDGRATVVAGETATARDLLDKVTATRATDVLLLSGRMLDEIYPEPLATLERDRVGVLQRVSPQDTLLGIEAVREIAGMPFVSLRAHTLPRSRARFKRAVEMLGLLVAAPLVLPLVGAVAAYVRLVAGSPVLFRQERVGLEGHTFEMVKFRTMFRDAEDAGPVMWTRDDPRVVPGCRWLRAMRLDELPQLWNVVRGEMSIVGPRPERPELTAQYESLIPGYARRHEIPPGITGLAQISGRYHTDPEYKLGHDLQYLVNWSPVLDLQVLLRTVWVVLTRRV